MSTDLALVTNGQDAVALGTVLAKSGYFQDAKDAAQAAVKVLAGAELGIGPIAAMTGIYIVKGRVTMSANLMAAQIKRSGRYTYVVKELSDEACVLEFVEQGKSIGVSAFTKADATHAGLWNSSDPWKKTPRNMLFARAMSNGAKWYCPDIFAGPVYTPDELASEETQITVVAPPVEPTTGEIITAPMTAEQANSVIREVRHLVMKIKELGETPAAKPDGKLADLPYETAMAYIETLRKQQRDALAKLPAEVEEAEVLEPAL